MQHRIEKGQLLNEKGMLNEAGYAFALDKVYDRKAIKAPKWRIKEWDYYYIGNNHKGVAFTIDDNSYMGLGSVSILDFDKSNYITKSSMKFFTKGKINLPSSSVSGDVVWKDKNYYLKFSTNKGKRTIDIKVNNYVDKKPFSAHFDLEEKVDGSMVIVTPFNKPKYFYYNQKINLLKANGYMKLGDKIFDFNDNSYGVLDWGRGVWTYKNTWYWSSMSGAYKGKRIGFNLGYGFGNTSTHSENIFFYDDKSYKLEDVHFDIPIGKRGKDSYLEKWKFRSQTGDINLTFEPILNRHANMNIGVIKSLQNQVFGYFSGYIIVNGEEHFFADILGFAEKVSNKW